MVAKYILHSRRFQGSRSKLWHLYHRMRCYLSAVMGRRQTAPAHLPPILHPWTACPRMLVTVEIFTIETQQEISTSVIFLEVIREHLPTHHRVYQNHQIIVRWLRQQFTIAWRWCDWDKVQQLMRRQEVAQIQPPPPCPVSLSQLFLVISRLLANSRTVFCFLLAEEEENSRLVCRWISWMCGCRLKNEW